MSPGHTVTALAGRLCEKAVAWLARAREHFVFDGATGILPGHENDVYKPLGELALAGSLVLRHGVAGEETRVAAAGLVDFAWQQLHCGDILYERLLRNISLTDPLEIYHHFHRAGYRHLGLDRLLRHVRELRQARAAELAPARALAVCNAERALGLPTWDRAELTRCCWLGGRPEPWTLTFESAYTVTHTVFHLTDWGLACADLPPDMDEYLRRWLPAWLEVYGEAGQWDLVGELLIADQCLSRPGGHPHIWERLVAAQRPDGLLPAGPEPLPRDPAAVARRHYHPTVVAAIAGTVALSRAAVR